MDCFLVSRGIKTLAVRMERHNSNGMAVAKFLESHRRVQRVIYPGLTSHAQHELAKRQQRGFGAMITRDVGSLDAARKLMDHVRLCSLAESLGGVETLISHPAQMTHSSIHSRGATGYRRYRRAGASGRGGIEDVEDADRGSRSGCARDLSGALDIPNRCR